MAQVSFSSIFKSTSANQEEESQSFTGSKLSSATEVKFVSQDPASTTFSGNNVPGNLTYTLNGSTVTVQGIVSRLFKSGSTIEGFYFIEAGSDYTLTNSETASAFILVYPSQESAFTSSPGTYGTSSDPVDSQLNALLAAQPTLVGITQNEADLTLSVNQTVTYTFTFSGDIDAASFTAADLANTGTAGVTFGTFTETSAGVFTVQVTATSAGTIKLSIVQNANIVSPTGFGLNTSSAINDDETLTVTAASTAITITSPTVNEASPYAVFTVTGTAGQTISLALANGTGAQGSGTDYGSSTATLNLQYSLDGGTTWLNYSTTGAPTLTSTSMLVRTPVVEDTLQDNGETFTLTATPASGTAVVGTATIDDQGGGTIYNADGTANTTATKTDDRVITITSPTVNEASPYAVFTVGGASGQTISLALANGTGAQGGGTDYGSSTATLNLQYSLDGGTTWLNYSTTGAPTLTSTSMLVRTPVVEDTLQDNGETFTLTATPAGGTAVVGTATIDDEGGGTIYNADGTVNNTATKTDDRTLSVTDPTVNEASPYAVFTVTGAVGQTLSLALANGTGAQGSGTDYGSSTATLNLQYSLDGGTTWLNYSTTGAPTLTSTSMLVRTPVVEDTVSDNGETFTLTVTPATGSAVVGTATIDDQGGGTIFNGDGTPNTTATKTDDRAITITSPTVNEASPYAVFTVGGAAGQTISLALANGTGAQGSGTDYGSGTVTLNLQYSLDGGTTWLNYSTTGAPTLTGTSMLVRTPVVEDTVSDNGETFTLTATPTGGVAAVGTATIDDAGGGTIFNGNGTPNTTATPTDDRVITVTSPTVNEASPYAVFTVGGAAGQTISLSLANGTGAQGSGTDYGSSTATLNLQYSLDGGTTWLNYSTTGAPTLTSTSMLVRTPVVEDSVQDNGETFTLTATPTGGTAVVGTATLNDVGGGSIYNANGTLNTTAVKSDDTPGLPIYFSALASGDRTLSTTASATDPNANIQFFATSLASADTLALKAWYNVLTGDWFYGRADVAAPYACYVERPDVVLGNVYAKDKGAYNVHTYLNSEGITQIMSAEAATALQLLNNGYVDLGDAYVFASETPVVVVGTSA